MEAIRVVVRVRPSKRPPAHTDDHEAMAAYLKESYGTDSEFYRCIDMPDEQHVQLFTADPRSGGKADMKEWQFDHCLWTHDDVEHPYVSQSEVFARVGRPLVDRCFAGFNACMFAYGQTGSGKTYTMQGLDYSVTKSKSPSEIAEHEGIVPRVFRALADEKQRVSAAAGGFLDVSMSFLEIYNEKLRDLLSPAKNNNDQGIKVFQARDGSGTSQFFRRDGANESEQKCSYPISNLQQMEQYYRFGVMQRTVGATKMNAHSSRSHTVVVFNLKRREAAGKPETVSQLFLVDLAGSENAGKTGAEGQRAAEAAAINASLLELGKIIETKASGKPVISYRNSLLTMMLQNAIGGNSYTVMLGAVGPSSYNLAEIKNTLEYCARASTIKCVTRAAVIAASRVQAVDLKRENEALVQERDELQKQLEELKRTAARTTEVDSLRLALAEKEAELARQQVELRESAISESDLFDVMRKRAEEQLRSLESELQASGLETDAAASATLPLLVNLNRDPTMDGTVRYVIKPSQANVVGGGGNVSVIGYGVRANHAALVWDGRALLLTPTAGETRVNGSAVALGVPCTLRHNDRVCFGEYSLFRVDLHEKGEPATWHDAMRELTIGRGLFDQDAFDQDKAELDKARTEIDQLRVQLEARRTQEDEARLRELEREARAKQQKLALDAELVRWIEEARIANRLVDELDIMPHLSFVPQLIARQTAGGDRAEVVIAVTSTEGQTSKEFIWPSSRFEDLLHTMQELELKRSSGAAADTDADIDDAGDLDFAMDIDQEYGQAVVPLQLLFHFFDIDDSEGGPSSQDILNTVNVRSCGRLFMFVKIKADLTEADEDALCDDSEAVVLGVWQRLRDQRKSVRLTIDIRSADGLVGDACEGAYCLYTIDDETVRTPVSRVRTTKPRFDHVHEFTLRVTDELIAWIRDGTLVVRVLYEAKQSTLVVGGARERGASNLSAIPPSLAVPAASATKPAVVAAAPPAATLTAGASRSAAASNRSSTGTHSSVVADTFAALAKAEKLRTQRGLIAAKAFGDVLRQRATKKRVTRLEGLIGSTLTGVDSADVLSMASEDEIQTARGRRLPSGVVRRSVRIAPGVVGGGASQGALTPSGRPPLFPGSTPKSGTFDGPSTPDLQRVDSADTATADTTMLVAQPSDVFLSKAVTFDAITDASEEVRDLRQRLQMAMAMIKSLQAKLVAYKQAARRSQRSSAALNVAALRGAGVLQPPPPLGPSSPASPAAGADRSEAAELRARVHVLERALAAAQTAGTQQKACCALM